MQRNQFVLATLSNWRRARIAEASCAAFLLAAAYSCSAPWWTASLGLGVFASAVRLHGQLAPAAMGLTIGTLINAIALNWLPAGLARSSGCSFGIALAVSFLAAVIYGARYSVAAWVETRALSNGWPEGLGLLLAYAAAEAILPGPMPWYLGPAEDPAHWHLELSIVPSATLQAATTFGLGARITVGSTLLNLPAVDGAPPVDDDVSSWEMVTYEPPPSAHLLTEMVVDGLARH